MAGVAGHTASAKIGTDIILELGEWTADIERALEDDTEFGDTWESLVPTLGKGSFSLKGRWAMGGTQQAALQTAMLNGTSVALRLYTGAATYYSGTAYLEKLSPAASVSGLVTLDISGRFSGAVSYT